MSYQSPYKSEFAADIPVEQQTRPVSVVVTRYGVTLTIYDAGILLSRLRTFFFDFLMFFNLGFVGPEQGIAGNCPYSIT
jgi:hypothetical protein